ncbi:hypothetical protein LSG31_14545 [Fodinisporobacter ferrooxydans]|uniref:Transposase DDE domain-containing protein n=1 Tax=Fodinisporobacter ferrooxydans TaxID=2901836 RepID=A0ABY4CI98_9BACL|nr:hypothetical protein LSG31_14545 [Alicyclobacillaceae bacterium MYW30-H2]
MKWWKRLLRKRLKRAFGWKELQRAIRLVSAMYRVAKSLTALSGALRSGESRNLLRMFYKVMSKR